MTKIIVDLDSIDQNTINVIYTYSDLKEKIREGEERLTKLKDDLHHLIASTNFKYVEQEEVSVEVEKDKHSFPSFMGIDSLKGLTYWIDYNRDDGAATKEYEELRGIMKRMYNVYSPSWIAHIIRCNFDVSEFSIPEMNIIIDKIYGVVTSYSRYETPHDPFVEFFFSNIYHISEIVEKTSASISYTEKK